MKCFAQLLVSIFLIGISSISNAQVQAPSNPNSAKSCAICHYRWIDTFFIEGRGTDFVEYTAEKVVATSEMCFSCHDGSIADSRARAYDTAQHKTNVPPPDHMKIPAIFPLDEKGNMQCATCHTAHGSAYESYLIKSGKDSSLCLICHGDKNNLTPEDKKRTMHVVNATPQTAQIPAELLNNGARVGNKGELICQSCHKVHHNPIKRSHFC